ncbi:MAG: hypothetical protein IPF58_07975 [Saprospirales bacterium]|nr:hypothetical protein [Saprospirales bacterium]
MTLIFTIPYPIRFLQNDISLEEENQAAKEYKDRPVSPFENNTDKDEFTGLFAGNRNGRFGRKRNRNLYLCR